MGLNVQQFTEEVTVQEIENLIIRNVVTDGIPAVTRGLLSTRREILEEWVADERAPDDTSVEGEVAERLFKMGALRGYKAIFPKTGSGDDNLPMWPDSMPLDIAWPRWLVFTIGHILGRRDATEAEVLYARGRSMSTDRDE